MSHAAILIPGVDRIGGAEQQAMLLAKGLRRRGWRVTLVALSGAGGAAAEELCEACVKFESLEMRKGLADPRGWFRFVRWLWREQADVVHAHLPHAAWLARWSRLVASVGAMPMPVVIDTLHSSSVGSRGRRIGYRWSRRLPDHVTAVSEATAASHAAAGMVSTDRLTVMCNGIDVEAWRPDEQARRKTRRGLGLVDEFLWLAVGRLETVKDFPTLLHAMTRTPEAARLVVLGAGPLQGELKDLAARLGLERRVQFMGFERNVNRWMQAADGFVLSSRYEGLPMVLLEAGACGLPAVATDVAGTREVIVNRETGLLSRAGDAEDLAGQMSRLMRMPAGERLAMGECARRHVAEQFNQETVLDQWEALYKRLLESRRNPRSIRLAVRENLRRRSAPSA